MATRRPLIIDNGRVRELPEGDSLNASETLERFAVPISSTEGSEPELIFTAEGDIVIQLLLEGEL